MLHESEAAAPSQSISGLNSTAPRVEVSRGGAGQSDDKGANGRRRRRTKTVGSSGKCIRALMISIMPVHCQRGWVQPPMAAKHPTMTPTAGTLSVQDLGAGQWGILGLARQSSNTGNTSSVRGRLID